MTRIIRALILAIWALGAMVNSAQAVSIEKVVGDIEEGWSIGFLPDGGFLVTLRDGELRYYDQEMRMTRVLGVPKVHTSGQGGLLDVMIPKDFAQSREIYLSYAKKGKGTALAKARLSEDHAQLENLQDIFVMKSPAYDDLHFGGRIVEAHDGAIFLTIGDRGNRNEAQNPASHNGSVVRIQAEGGAARGNPTSPLPEIYSIGHRNPQGAALDASGQLWVHEHGPKGGDEVNLVRVGRNYGWPLIGYGVHYSGAQIGVGTHSEGLEQPAYYWDPSIAPSGLAIHSGKNAPTWKGLFFVGSLKFDEIQLLRREADGLKLHSKIKTSQTGRVRDIREAPDGSIWFISVNDRAIYRIKP